MPLITSRIFSKINLANTASFPGTDTCPVLLLCITSFQVLILCITSFPATNTLHYIFPVLLPCIISFPSIVAHLIFPQYCYYASHLSQVLLLCILSFLCTVILHPRYCYSASNHTRYFNPTIVLSLIDFPYFVSQ